MHESIKKADVLIEALPYIRKFYDKTVVIKYGGAAMMDPALRRDVLEDIVFMSYVGMRPVIVHGGGPFISKRLKEMDREVKFVKGFRVTDEDTMEVVEDELRKLNREINRDITSLGGSAVSLSGHEDHLIEVSRMTVDGEDIGFVGNITRVNADVVRRMLTGDIIPVISPLGIGKEGATYNVNADTAAAEISRALHAQKLVLLTDVRGILRDRDNAESLVTHAGESEIADMIASGVIAGGMIPKVNACLRALNHGVKKTHIIDGRIPHGLLLEIFTDKGIGTEIER